MKSASLWPRVLHNLIFYSIDVGSMLVVWIYGLGLTIHNWYVVVGVAFFIRWISSVLQHASWLRLTSIEEAQKASTP